MSKVSPSVDPIDYDYKPRNRLSIPREPGAVITNKIPAKMKVRDLSAGATFVYSDGKVDNYFVLGDALMATNVLTGCSEYLAGNLEVTPAVFKISVRKLRVM